MKHLFTTLALVIGVAVSAGVIAYRNSGDPAVQKALSSQDALEWLRTDFRLNDEQFAAIKKLHDAYSFVCEAHCRDIQHAVKARNELRSTGGADPVGLAAADRRVEELRLVCESAIATHVRQCAAQMSPDSAERYLALVLPKIKDFDHLAPPDLRLNHSQH